MVLIPGTSLLLKENLSARRFTSLGVGGTCRYVAELERPEDLPPTLEWAKHHGLEVLYLGDGTNVLFADSGFSGLVLLNRIRGRTRRAEVVTVASGESLFELIRWLNQQQLGGMERMYGIPGTLGGAVVGNAGAYGQEIADSVLEIEVFGPDGPTFLPKENLQFRYRHSILKDLPELYLLRATFRLREGCRGLEETSEEILLTRRRKYPPELKCPGSFFKNPRLDEVPPTALDFLPPEIACHGKIPAGRLLEAVGANGTSLGQAQIADYHGNLLINRGNATGSEILGLARMMANRVRNRFGIELVPEVRIVAMPEENPFAVLDCDAVTDRFHPTEESRP